MWAQRRRLISVELLRLRPTYFRDGEPDHALLIAVQDTPSLDLYDAEGNLVEAGQESDGEADTPDGIPEPFEGLGKGKALTAGNAAGTGYITVAYNNDSSLGGLPVSLQVIKVECARNTAGEESPYRGNLLVIKSDNLFDEKLTIRHTGDFGGRPDNFTFDWWIAAVDDTAVSPVLAPPSYPWQPWTAPEKGASLLGPQITIEGANPTTLRDNWVIVRYKNKTCPVCGNQYTWSAFAGDPSAKPSELRAQLAEGWIKRVTNALNPFDTRVDDFVSAPTNTTVDMIRQAGPRYEGPVAMNNDPDTLNKMGLIEAYQTVLDRGRDLSIDAGVNDQGANAALLNVTSRIASLYMLLANDAYMDALDPTIGLGTQQQPRGAGAGAVRLRQPVPGGPVRADRRGAGPAPRSRRDPGRGRRGADLQPADLELHERRRRSRVRDELQHQGPQPGRVRQRGRCGAGVSAGPRRRLGAFPDGPDQVLRAAATPELHLGAAGRAAERRGCAGRGRLLR